jgi:hypothetical protein
MKTKLIENLIEKLLDSDGETSGEGPFEIGVVK